MRQAKCRASKKNVSLSTPAPSTSALANSPAYRSSQSFGKAYRKACSALPKSPRKVKAVVRRLAYEMGCSIKEPPTKKHKAALPNETEELVKAFYCSAEISRCAPGKKDYVIIRGVDGKKEKIQRRNLLMTVKEAYNLFKADNPSITIGKSKFACLCPQHVKLVSDLSQNVCLCRYHENLNLLLSACNGAGLDIPQMTYDFVKFVVCNDESEQCMLANVCDECKDGKLFDVKVQGYDAELLAAPVTWYQWETEDQHAVKTVHEGTVCDALDTIKAQLQPFLAHCFIKRKQSAAFQSHQSSVSQVSALVQVDFSENYSSQYQDEIQSAHWHYKQITVFTCIVWVAGTSHSYALVSDYLSHDKLAVYRFLKIVLDAMKSKHPTVENVCFFSDGAASQFKQKFLFVNLTFLKEEYKLQNLTWNFFATSHGKGAVDGVGGTVKRLVWSRVLAGKALITDAQSFYECAKAASSGLQLVLVSPEEIEGEKEILEARWENCRSLSQTQAVHCIEGRQPYRIVSKRFFSDTKQTVFDFKEGIIVTQQPLTSTDNAGNNDSAGAEISVAQPTKFVVGQYVLAKFATKRKQVNYVGIIETSDKYEVEVTFLRKETSDVFVKPAKIDKSWLHVTNIERVLSPPVIDNRGHYKFEEAVEAC